MNADEKTCPRCAETIKAAAVVCRYCGHEFGNVDALKTSRVASVSPPPVAPKEQDPKRANIFGRVAGIGCLGLLGLAAIGAIVGQTNVQNAASNVEGNSPTEDESATLNSAATSDGSTPLANEQSDWSYDTESDQVRGKKVYYASVDSQNQVDFDFPYAGGSTLTMTVRKHPQYGQDVIFHISKGQFVCGVENCSGTINYGHGPQRLSLSESGDYDSESLFASNGPSVIGNLKKTDKVVVELPFYQEGNRQFTFATKGLKWPPAG